MGKTTLTNNLDFDVQVKEGNTNIFRLVRVLEKGRTMTIKADSSTTYREYTLVLLPDNKKLRPLSSDDIRDLQAVEIFKDEETGEYDWRELRKGAGNSTLFDSLLGRFLSKPDNPPGEGLSAPRLSGEGPLAPRPLGEGPSAPRPSGEGSSTPPPLGEGSLAPPPPGEGPLALLQLGDNPQSQEQPGEGPSAPRPLGEGSPAPPPSGEGPPAPPQLGDNPQSQEQSGEGPSVLRPPSDNPQSQELGDNPQEIIAAPIGIRSS